VRLFGRINVSQTIRGLLFGCLLCGGAVSPLASLGADDDQANAKPAPALPVDRNLWLNTTPLTWEQLRGKGVYVYIFDGNPSGTETLAVHLAAAKQHVQDPIVFLGIAMGTTQKETDLYLKQIGFNWPTLCDPYFTYTRQCDTAMDLKGQDGIAECYFGVAYVTHDGKLVQGWTDDPEETVKAALEEAAWTTSPKDIPEPILPIWKSIELRKYSEAVPLLKKGLNAGPEEHKVAARKMQEVVTAQIERLVDEARTADEADQKWIAFRKLNRVLEDFRGYDLPKDLEPLQKKLSRSPQVKAGQTAEKQLAIAGQGLASPSLPLRKKAQIQLEKIIADFPDSDLAERATKLLESAQAPPKK